jgi:hypothetical protein
VCVSFYIRRRHREDQRVESSKHTPDKKKEWKTIQDRDTLVKALSIKGGRKHGGASNAVLRHQLQPQPCIFDYGIDKLHALGGGTIAKLLEGVTFF